MIRVKLPFVCRNLMNVRHHWSEPGRIQKRCSGYVFAQIGKESAEVGKRRMVITLHRNPAHALDRDGAYASVKPLVDAIKKLRHLKDDSEEWLDLSVVQADSKQRSTLVEIFEIEGG